MREIRKSGSEGGARQTNVSFLPLSLPRASARQRASSPGGGSGFIFFHFFQRPHDFLRPRETMLTRDSRNKLPSSAGTDADHKTHRPPSAPDSPPAIHDSAIYNSAPLRDCNASVIHGRDDRAPLFRTPRGSGIRNLGGFIVLA
jgi:hypothetical protein